MSDIIKTLADIQVSDEDKHVLLDYKWYIGKDGISSTFKRKNWVLHRYIYGEQMGNPITRYMKICHKDNDKFNNRRENLVLRSAGQVALSSTKKAANATSSYYGVQKKSDIFFTMEIRNLTYKMDVYASYAIETHAAWHYNLVMIEYNVECAPLNDLVEPTGFVRFVSTKIVEQMTEKQLDLIKTAETERNNRIRSQPILRNKKNLAIIPISHKDGTISNIIVDDDDYYNLMVVKTTVGCGITVNDNYAKIRINGQEIKLHRYIMGYDKDNNLREVDHRSDKLLDNRKSKLRIVSGFSSKYNGIIYKKDTGKYHVVINFNDKTIKLGSYLNEINAGIAYDVYASEYFKDTQCIYNFPDNTLEMNLDRLNILNPKRSKKYIGIYSSEENKWTAKIYIDNKLKEIGTYDSELEAHQARISKLKF